MNIAPKTPNGGAPLLSSLGDAEVWLEYEYSPGDPGQTSGPPDRCYPPEPEEICVMSVLINNEWIDPDDDHFSASQIARWEMAIGEHVQNQREADEAEAADAYAAQREEW